MASGKKLVAILPGDGVGPEVIAQARRVLEFFRDERGLPLDLWELDLGADRFLKDGTTFPKEIADRIAREASAVLLGALGDPRVPGLGYARDILFGLRFGLDLYANIRPIKALADRLVPLVGRKAKDVDFVVFRENTEGIYVGIGGQFKRGTLDEIAINEDVNTRKGVHMADKSNAMKHAHELWYRCFFEVAGRYPGIEAKHMYVDAMCMHMVLDPSQFQVIVTCNLFGDIISDLGAQLIGGLGLAPSGNIHPGKTSLFEPVHGSAPNIAGKGIANPLGSVLTSAMMLEFLGWQPEAERIRKAVKSAFLKNILTPDLGGEKKTIEVGDWLAANV
jgi:3-isopropylmalate dehydrogenase